MTKAKKSPSGISIYHLAVLALLLLGVAIGVSQPTRFVNKAAEVPYVLRSTVTSPAWGTVYTWKERARVDVSIEHTYPISKVVFRLHAGNTSKNVCTITTEPYFCEYTVPYTGGGTGIPRGSNSGYAMEIYSYDTMGHIYVESLQLWSHK